MMKNKFSKGLVVVLFLIFANLLPLQNQAQCAMCKMVPESNYKGGGRAGQGLNRGIAYLLVLPYILVGSIGYIWWKNQKKTLKEQETELFSNN